MSAPHLPTRGAELILSDAVVPEIQRGKCRIFRYNEMLALFPSLSAKHARTGLLTALLIPMSTAQNRIMRRAFQINSLGPANLARAAKRKLGRHCSTSPAIMFSAHILATALIFLGRKRILSPPAVFTASASALAINSRRLSPRKIT